MTELNNTGLLICVELFLFCILILTVLFIYTIRFIKREQFKTSRYILAVNVCYGIVVDVDLINAIFTWSPTEYIGLSYFVNILRYIAYILAALFWFLYCQKIFHSRLFSKKIFMVLACLPAIIAVALVLISPFNGIAYTITELGVVRGPYYIFIQYSTYIYIIGASILAFIRIIRTKDKDERKRNWSVIIFALPIIVSDILQTITGYPFLCVGVSIALTLVFANLIIEVHFKNQQKDFLRKQRRDALVSGLTEDYEGVFIVDVDNDTIKSVRVSEAYKKIFEHVEGEKKYTDRMLEAANQYMIDEDREENYNKFRLENVWQKLQENISFAISYRIISKNNEELYYRAKFVRLQDRDARRFLLGFRNVDSEMRTELELEKLREENNIRKRTSMLQSIIEAMTSEYVMLATLNLDTGDMDRYRISERYNTYMNFEHSVKEYGTLVVFFADRFVEKDYREAFIREMNADTIVKCLRERDIYSIRFKLVGVDSWYEVNMAQYDEVNRTVVIGARNIDEVVKAEQHREEIAKELEDARQLQFIAGLTQDFDCVSYIDVENDFFETFYRTSPIFYNRIPDWAKGVGFRIRIKEYSNIFVVPEDREKFLQEVDTDNLVKKLSEKPVYFLNFRINVDDEIRYYQIKFIADKVDDKLRGIIAGFHDVDDEMKEELKRQEILEDARRMAEEVSRAKTLFLFNMSHDIRTPMNAIMGFTNIALKNIDDRDRAIDALNKTQESSKVLLDLINQILDMSRIESGKVVLAEDKADMYNFGKDVLPMLEELARDKDIDFRYNINYIKDEYVTLDRTRINEVLVNIIGNAIKYTQNGGEVTTNVRQLEYDKEDYGLYEIEVSDNGFGMSKEFLGHMFENFSREESASKSGIQGTGLGLPLCKKIIDLMNGTIEVESEENVGSTFTITLPFEKIGKDSIRDDEFATDVEYDFEGKRILLVEDNDLNREIAVDILKEDGFEVEEAREGREAIDMVKRYGEEYYDYILMDIRMPVMDGYEATKYIRGFCSKRHIPIIALSANAFEEDRAKSIKVGMDDHVAKPIEIDKLKKTLARFL